nr:helix-turn-helix domain-containing protein [uncultured Butyricicoccus sp.]
MFPQRLKQLRKEAHLTQKQLAEKLYVDQTSISYWESGKTKPDFDKQAELAKIFGVSLDYLRGIDNPANHILTLRKEHGLSQQALANLLNVNQTAVSQWERGATIPSATVMNDLCKLWNVTPDYLLGISDIKNAPTLNGVDAEELQQLKELVDQLTPEQQQELLRYGRYLASQPPFSKDS